MGQATDATSLRLFTTTQFNLLAETGMRNAEVRADELPSMNYPGLAGHGVNYPELPRSHLRRSQERPLATELRQRRVLFGVQRARQAVHCACPLRHGPCQWHLR